MTPPAPVVTIDLVALEATSASGLYGLQEVLSSVGVVWESLVSGRPAAPRFSVRIVGLDPAPFTCASGALVRPDVAIDAAADADIVLIPAVRASPDERFAPLAPSLADWLGARRRGGARLVSACTGALVLAEAGVLDGVEATTHWAFRETFRRHYPKVDLRLERTLCGTGPDERILTSGGATAWQQLALFLIGRYCGREHALQTAKFWLLPDTGDLQAPYAAMTSGAPHEDSGIRACQRWIQLHFATQNPVDAMMERAKLPPTTFARRFKRATGYVPMEYVHAVRVEAAKHLLETTVQPVEQIGGRIGYKDTASFRRLFKRKTGLTPSEYRRLFGATRFGSPAFAGARPGAA